nr:MAG TPA: hypothetical protein [Caudoviricetes sp.]
MSEQRDVSAPVPVLVLLVLLVPAPLSVRRQRTVCTTFCTTPVRRQRNPVPKVPVLVSGFYVFGTDFSLESCGWYQKYQKYHFFLKILEEEEEEDRETPKTGTQDKSQKKVVLLVLLVPGPVRDQTVTGSLPDRDLRGSPLARLAPGLFPVL